MADSLRASQQGLKIVERCRRKKGWNKDAAAWIEEAKTSRATLQRFWKGQPIRQEYFVAICKSVGIDNWEEIVDDSPVQTEDDLEDQPNDQEAYDASATWQRERYYGQFIGRGDELQEILKCLESEEEPKVLSIVGIGGLGKTALCHRLVDCAYQAKIFSKFAWIRAKIYQYQTDSLGRPQSCRDSYLTPEDALKDIGKELKLPNWILQDPDRIRSEIARVLSLSRCLIVIDGLEDTESPGVLATELSSLLGKSRLILTSRQLTDTNIFEYKLRKQRCLSLFFYKKVGKY